MMNKKKMSAAAIILVIGLLVVLVTISNNRVPTSQEVEEKIGQEQEIGTNIAFKTNQTKTAMTTNNVSNKTGGISQETLKKHGDENDCWVGYSGKVYDITNFLPDHPGSAGRIIPFCGTEKEFTKNFIAQHGTSQVKRLMRVGVLMGDFEIKGELS